jgi:broad specificity phosphatase PhoE
MKIYIIRHGEAAKSWEVDRDPELSLKGREQAQNISDILAQEDLNDFQIISSPLRRAIETSKPISKKLNKEVKINESFVEIPSPGINMSERPSWLREMFSKDVDQFEKPQADWRDKIINVTHSFKSPTLIFSHFMVINVLVGYLQKSKKIVTFYPDNCSVTKMSLNQGMLSLEEIGSNQESEVN